MRLSTTPLLVLAIALPACGDKSSDSGDSGGSESGADTGASDVDADADGFTEDEDCDDSDANVHPGATEICDGVDQNCDGHIDNNPSDGVSFYEDLDGDGFGNPASGAEFCDDPGDRVTDFSDCDDTDAAIHPGSAEVCNGLDDDCNGVADDGATDAQTWYEDADGDGFGDPDVSQSACSPGTGWVLDDQDCEPAEASAYPDSHEIETPRDGIDTNCDGDDDCIDLNCDAWPDLVFPAFNADGSTSAETRVFWGENGVFDTSTHLALEAGGATEVAVEDLDDDGYLDILQFHLSSGGSAYANAWIYHGSAAGFSDSDRTNLEGESAKTGCIGDFDGGGSPDIVLASVGKITMVYMGEAGWDESTRLELDLDMVWACDARDLDGDGYDDLALSIWYADGSSNTDSMVFWGSASGLSEDDTTLLPTLGAREMVVDDFDGDGETDLFFVGHSVGLSHAIDSYVYWGDGNRFEDDEYTAVVGDGPNTGAIAHLNADSLPDMVLANEGTYTYGTGRSYVVYGDAARSFDEDNRDELITTNPTDMAVVDLDHDGHPDLIFVERIDGGGTTTTSDDAYANTAVVYWGNEADSAMDEVFYSDSHTGGYTEIATAGARNMTVGDIDGDGFVELVFGNYSEDGMEESLVYYTDGLRSTLGWTELPLETYFADGTPSCSGG